MNNQLPNNQVAVEALQVSAYRIPTDQPESDGTFAWQSTTVVVVEAHAAGQTGVGYTYNDVAAAWLADKKLAPMIVGRNALAVKAAWDAMYDAVRNIGQPGVAAAAISAVDTALWDLKARLLGVPLVTLLGAVHKQVPVYGSGGFTSYSKKRLQRQLHSWVTQGIQKVKMKIGRHPEDDLDRVKAAREAIGKNADLMVDANGAFSRKQALRFAERFADYGVVWFEEPVSSDDLRGLRLLCQRAPSVIEIATGEYGSNRFYFRRILEADAADVLQADATRCGGITGFLQAANLCEAYNVDLSAHVAPNLHVHPACAVTPMRHIEYFHDNIGVEPLLFDGTLEPVDGALQPNLQYLGSGLRLRHEAAEEHQIYTQQKTV